MYCQKCGRRITKGTEKCPECGSSVADSYCGGFWDLLEGRPLIVDQKHEASGRSEPADSGTDVKKELQTAGKEIEMAESRYRRLVKVVCAFLIIALLVLGIQTIRIASLNSTISDLENENRQLEEKYVSLQNEVKEKEEEWSKALANNLTQRIFGSNNDRSEYDYYDDNTGNLDNDD